eukprot:TRINITY_DN8821_c0_g1_i1.p1 TRINITY_DN8821_c0_g1~~TRINITY_DN8821_c0_g1_i1.p1  ORF type:complete len:388 (-),score=87.27 TRINITY_DN8821_c0_g1_i1:125-1288(-)
MCIRDRVSTQSTGIVEMYDGSLLLRTHHSTALRPHQPTQAFVFGGLQSNGSELNDVQVRTEGAGWATVKCANSPGVRFGHSAFFCDPMRMCLFGGCDKSTYQWFNDVHVLELDSMEWQQVKPVGGEPTPRCGHSATPVGNCEVLVFGGCNNKRDLRDLWVLSTYEGAFEWAQDAAAHGQPPMPRAFHTGTFVNDYLYIIGGRSLHRMSRSEFFLNDVYRYSVQSGEWQPVLFDGQEPFPSRAFHAATAHAGKIYMTGGYDGEEWRSDVISISLDPPSWAILGQMPEPRAKHSCSIFEGHLVLIGGENHTETALESLWIDLEELALAAEEVAAAAQEPYQEGRPDLSYEGTVGVDNNGLQQEHVLYDQEGLAQQQACLLYTSPSPRDS